MDSTTLCKASILSSISGLVSVLATFWRSLFAKTEWAVSEDSPSTIDPVTSVWFEWLPWLAGLEEVTVCDDGLFAAAVGVGDDDDCFVRSTSSNWTT